MAESLLQDYQPSDGESPSSPEFTGSEYAVSANTNIPRARLLAAPPRDVTRLLKRHGATLPRYLDAQRWRDIGHSHQRWPLLWSTAPAGSVGKP